jgi:hypothetical protein
MLPPSVLAGLRLSAAEACGRLPGRAAVDLGSQPVHAVQPERGRAESAAGRVRARTIRKHLGGNTAKAKPQTKDSGSRAIVIQAPNIRQFKITIIGESGLICNRKDPDIDFGVTRGTPRNVREDRNPDAEAQATLYEMEKKRGAAQEYGFPLTGLKKSMVTSTDWRALGVSQAMLRKAIFFHPHPGGYGVLLKVTGTHEMRRDLVKLKGGGSQIRFRSWFPTWQIRDLLIDYDADLIEGQAVVNMIERGGRSIGIGDWRQEKDGVFGRYHVKRT